MESRECNGSGMFNSYPVKYSNETKDLLKVMMNESKITNIMRKEIAKNITEGHSLPVSATSKANPKKVDGRKPNKLRSAGGGGLRTRETIERMETAQQTLRPCLARTVDRNKEKEKLANIMAFGEDLQVKKKPESKSRPSTVIQDRFDELVDEVADRRRFLAEMEKLGKANSYRSSIETEISKMILEMEQIDQKRTRALENMKKTK